MQVSQTQGIQQYIAVSKTAQKAETADKLKEQNPTEENAAKTDKVELSAYAKITSMSDSERAALVESLKAEQEVQMDRFIDMMTQMFNKQGTTAAIAQNDSFWRMFASGDLTVDAQTKADAQAAISEDGYWGVKQTSERIFTMALALSGGDEAMMQKMQAAVEKGFEQAAKAWGGKLPSITDDTHEAINQLFSDYYAKFSKTEDTEAAEDKDVKETDKAEKTEEKAEDIKSAEEESQDSESKASGSVGINAGKLARMLASAKTRSQVQAVLAKIQSDLKECDSGRAQGLEVDEASVKAAEQLLQQANSRMGSAEDREATPEEEMAAAMAALM